MKYIIFLCIFLLSGCESLQEHIYWSHFSGAKKHGYCAKYASKVTSELQKRGIKAYYVEYKWDLNEKQGCHAIVLFKKNNKWFIVDNETAFPCEIKIKPTILETVKQFCPEAYELRYDVSISE